MRFFPPPAAGVALAALVACGDPPTGPLSAGAWGGVGIAFVVTAAGADVELDCAHGRVEARVVLDGDGRFDLPGFMVPEGGPVREGEEPPREPVRFAGEVRDGRMTLEIVWTDTGSVAGPYELERGREPELRKCL